MVESMAFCYEIATKKDMNITCLKQAYITLDVMMHLYSSLLDYLQ